ATEVLVIQQPTIGHDEVRAEVRAAGDLRQERCAESSRGRLGELTRGVTRHDDGVRVGSEHNWPAPMVELVEASRTWIRERRSRQARPPRFVRPPSSLSRLDEGKLCYRAGERLPETHVEVHGPGG